MKDCFQKSNTLNQHLNFKKNSFLIHSYSSASNFPSEIPKSKTRNNSIPQTTFNQELKTNSIEQISQTNSDNNDKLLNILFNEDNNQKNTTVLNKVQQQIQNISFSDLDVQKWVSDDTQNIDNNINNLKIEETSDEEFFNFDLLDTLEFESNKIPLFSKVDEKGIFYKILFKCQEKTEFNFPKRKRKCLSLKKKTYSYSILDDVCPIELGKSKTAQMKSLPKKIKQAKKKYKKTLPLSVVKEVDDNKLEQTEVIN